MLRRQLVHESTRNDKPPNEIKTLIKKKGNTEFRKLVWDQR